ncbi:MAG TPA: glycine--tRNA ligase subunit beta [Bacillota bacterium]
MKTNDVLFEIGLEEVPARFIDDAEAQLAKKTQQWFHDARISYQSITSFSTPRRLAVLVTNVEEMQETIEEEVKGPSLKIAKDDNGNWTKAAIGFTSGQGQTVDDIYTKEIKGTPYVFVKKHIEGKKTIDLLPSFKEVIENLHFDNNMRWGSDAIRYVRPIRWLVALYGAEVIPFEIAHVQTSNRTRGHRFLGENIVLTEPRAYEKKLAEQYVIVHPKKREQLILEGIRKLEADKNIHIPIDNNLLNEVRNLVEYPTVFLGSFAEQYLELPKEVLVTSMREHQRYFPVEGGDHVLLPYFAGVRNGDDFALETVVKGNEKVLHARLSDAKFFFEEDQKQTIDSYQEKLTKVVFQEKLGTIHDKVQRVKSITETIAKWLQLNDKMTDQVSRAAEICKFDLVTNMVNEFTELQGVMGEKYALICGEDEEIAQAIKEHYLPKHADDDLPQSIFGSIVSIADKLDTIVGCISVGLMPSGSQDPYGLRRQAIGILRILKQRKWDISVDHLLTSAIELYQSSTVDMIDEKEIRADLNEFFTDRALYLLKKLNIEHDVAQAVLKNGIGIVPYTLDKAEILSEKRQDKTFKPVQEALVRVLNLAQKASETDVDPALFATPSEEQLYEALLSATDDYEIAHNSRQAEQALKAIETLTNPIHQFFEHNMVMADDHNIRTNRLSLLKHIADLIGDYADLSTIEWKQHFDH